MPAPAYDFDKLPLETQRELHRRMEFRQQYPAIDERQREEIITRSRYEGSFTEFIRACWPIIEPGNALEWSWHYDLIAEHLQLAYERKIKRLIINIPPRSLKSTIATIMFPTWIWTKRPNENFACASYAQPLAEEHSVKRRRIIESEWYQRHWGAKVWLQKDQNQKGKFQNNFQAQMIATSVGGTAQGLGGNILIVDDALKADEIASDAFIKELHNWWDNTWSQRLNNPANDVLIVVEQRIGELDLTGKLLGEDKILIEQGHAPQWTHLCLPLEADADEVDKVTLTKRIVFPVSHRVKERPLGDVLMPDRFPPAVVRAKKILRINWATQYQQRPSPLEGNMIKRSDIRYYGGIDPITAITDRKVPEKFDYIATSTDAAFKDTKTADFVCVLTFGVLGPDRFILDLTLAHLDEPATRMEINRQRLFWRASRHLIEDKANGPAIIKALRKYVPGVIEVDPQGGKISRFYAMCGEWQSGNWWLPRNAAWTERTVDHLTKFPAIKNDDDCDAISQAAIWAMNNNFAFGLTEAYKSLDAKAKEDMNKARQNRQANELPTGRASVDVGHVEPKGIPSTATLIVDEEAKEQGAGRDENGVPSIVGLGDGTITSDGEFHKVDEAESQAIEHPAGVAKIDADDKTLRCEIETCRSTVMQRIPGGYRCGQCGNQIKVGPGQKLPARIDFSIRK